LFPFIDYTTANLKKDCRKKFMTHAILKRTLDLAIAIPVLGLLWPFLLLISVLIKLDSKGPVLFVQGRLGKNGAVFNMFKFRTMVVNAEQTGTGLCSYHDDPRVTRVGKYLRAASLDELPQLFNVVMGPMSIVGPRPPVTYELGDYESLTDEMKIRFRVKPGITGLAQVSGRNGLDWNQKIALDNIYVERFTRLGILEDFVIGFRTIWVMLSMKNVIEQAPQEGDHGQPQP
jgi:lipopolysaccharide/colanic/teichoic acid biosynthesis glycosyltransferase